MLTHPERLDPRKHLILLKEQFDRIPESTANPSPEVLIVGKPEDDLEKLESHKGFFLNINELVFLRKNVRCKVSQVKVDVVHQILLHNRGFLDEALERKCIHQRKIVMQG